MPEFQSRQIYEHFPPFWLGEVEDVDSARGMHSAIPELAEAEGKPAAIRPEASTPGLKIALLREDTRELLRMLPVWLNTGDTDAVEEIDLTLLCLAGSRLASGGSRFLG